MEIPKEDVSSPNSGADHAEKDQDEIDKEFWRRRRRQWKDNMKKAKASFETKEEYLNSDLFARQREREDIKRRWRSVPLDQFKFYPPDIVIDLAYDSIMPDKDLRSLASQLMHAYGYLRKSDRPVKMHLTSLNGPVLEALNRVNGSTESWKVFRHEQPFHEVFDKSQLVYLSPDSPNVLEDLKANEIYVIGGLVDDNKLLNTSLTRATELGIRTARLPIQEKTADEYANLSLCVNQVFDILLDVASNGDWKGAFNKHIPSRFKIANRTAPKKSRAKMAAATAAAATTGVEFGAQPQDLPQAHQE